MLRLSAEPRSLGSNRTQIWKAELCLKENARAPERRPQAGCLDLVAAMFPAAADRDPEREQDEPDVEPEASASGVNPIVPELVAPSDIPRCVDLGDAGEPGAHAAALEVTRDLLEWDESAVGRLDLAGTEGARPDEA